MLTYEPVIGLEVHVQLNTKSKIFDPSPNRFGDMPNTNVNPICAGHPGVLPVANGDVIEKAMMAGLALDCSIANWCKFDRKHYFYPDLPKAYQISQYDLPICSNGSIEIEIDEKLKKIGITRIHMEEDAGKLIHSEVSGVNESYVDLNRAGTPLIEIVSEPDMRSPEEAYAYLTSLKSIMKYIGVSDVNMEEGSLRCDANVSVRPVGEVKFGTKVEIKNLNSFHGVAKAIEYEIQRQGAMLDKGERIVQETRLFDANQNKTFSMRSKEDTQDYRYFPDPDLVPLVISKEEIEKVRASLPELPKVKKERFISDYQIASYDAGVLTEDKDLSIYFEEAVSAFPDNPKKIANWIMSEVMRLLNDKGIEIKQFKVPAAEVGTLMSLVEKGDISGKIAKTVFDNMAETGEPSKKVIDKLGLKQNSNKDEILNFIRSAMAENESSVADYKGGKDKAFGFLVGQVMKKTKGQANPQMVNELLKKELAK